MCRDTKVQNLLRSDKIVRESKVKTKIILGTLIQIPKKSLFPRLVYYTKVLNFEVQILVQLQFINLKS